MTNEEKDVARRTLRRKIREGHITRGPCEVCGALDTDGHHEDYSKPLEVRWLCRTHHIEVHHGPTKQGRPARERVVDPETTGELATLSQHIREQQALLRTMETQRNQLVLQALGAGWTHAQISATTGLSRGRIGQIAQTGEKKS